MEKAAIPKRLAELQRAYELDPLSPIINASFGMVLYGVGRTDEAIDQLHKTLDLEPNLVAGHSMLGQIFEDQGKLGEAIAEYEKVRQLDPTPSSLAMIAGAQVKVGNAAGARKILEELTDRSREGYVGPYSLAVVHLALGDKEEALRLLEKSFEDRDILLQGMFGSIKIDKRLDPLRGDPRFQKLEERFMTGQPE